MTGSYQSFLYGAPTYALLQIIGFSVWTLRFPSVIYSLLSVVMFYIIGRRFFCPLIGALAAVLLAWNSNLISFARYGCSPAATLFSVLLAIFFTWLFLDSDKPSWWMGPVCGLSLCLATLQYAPARIGVLILLVFILAMVVRPWWLGFLCGLSICLAANQYAPARTGVFVLLGCILAVAIWQWRRCFWRRLLGVGLILLVVFSFYHFQESQRRTGWFLHGGGEQYFSRRARNKTLSEDFKTARSLVRGTGPEYLWLLSPHTSVTPERVLGEPSKNPLYYAPLLPFIVWGFVYSLLRIRRSWRHGFLFAWFVLYTPPLLLCNQVNPHRSQLLIISLLFWAAFGVQEAMCLMRRARIPQFMQHIFAVALILTMIYASVTIFFFRIVPRNPEYQAVSEEIALIPGPVVAGVRFQVHSSYASLLYLELLERTRLDPEGRHSTILEEVNGHIESDVASGKRPVPDAYLDILEKILGNATIILAPADKFMVLGEALRDRGNKMVLKQRGKYSFLLFPHEELSAGASKDEEVLEDIVEEPLDTEVATGTVKAAIRPSPILPTVEGPMVWAETLTPQKVEYGMAPPKFGQTFDGKSIIIGGRLYAHGIGVHSWCKLTYAVPEGSKIFQAIIGFPDWKRNEQPGSEATFKIYDEKDKMLYSSGVVTAKDLPAPVLVDVRGVRTLRLEVGPGSDGCEHDHLNWADAAFVLENGGPTRLITNEETTAEPKE